MRHAIRLCLLAIAFPVCAQQPAPANPAADFEKTWSDTEVQNDGAAARQYLRQWLPGTIWDDDGRKRRPIWPKEKAILECVTAIIPSPTAVRMVFVLDDKGIVRDAYTDQTGYVDSCVKSKIPGLRVPAPPTAPFALCSRYEKQSDSRTLVAGCGPNHFSEICERKGNTETCSVSQR
jgi:hypothetical protein